MEGGEAVSFQHGMKIPIWIEKTKQQTREELKSSFNLTHPF